MCSELRCLARFEVTDRYAFLSEVLEGQGFDEPYVDERSVEDALVQFAETPGWAVLWHDDSTLELQCDQDAPDDDGAALILVRQMVDVVEAAGVGAAYRYFTFCHIGLDEIDIEHARSDGEEGDLRSPTEVWERFDATGASWPVADDL